MLDLKVPPLLVVIITALLMWGLAKGLPAWGGPVPGRLFLSGGTALIGAAVILGGVVAFRLAGTTVNPLKPGSSSRLVTSGVYAWTRNPMYLGFLLLLLAWAMYLGHLLAPVFLPAFMLYLNRFQIEPEERALTALFGRDFTAYASRVRRWL